MTYRQLVAMLMEDGLAKHLDEEVRLAHSRFLGAGQEQYMYNAGKGSVDISVGNDSHPLFPNQMYLYGANMEAATCHFNVEKERYQVELITDEYGKEVTSHIFKT